MTRARPRPWRFAPLLVLIAVGTEPSIGEPPARPPAPQSAPGSLFDPRLASIRRASVAWESRGGPSRVVVDQVCLVRDLPSFLGAIATWDRGHAFPILFEDVESSFRFIRAFKPARVVRFAGPSRPVPPERAWDRAVEAVGASWAVSAGSSAGLPGDAVPRAIGATPPGVVLSSPDAPMLAGAIALAAGRFQPLLRLESRKRYADVLSLDEFLGFDIELTAAIQAATPQYSSLGDDCDFVTLAGDWPYRYRGPKGDLFAVDDRVARSVVTGNRWGFAGRLMGNSAESVYRAMCSLFLQPDSALMFNGYDDRSPPWSDYSMREAAARLSAVVPTSQVSGEREAGLDGWHEAFDPLNKYGLVLINSHGMPRVFNLRSGPASAADIPRGVPSAVLMIHSFSAADPADPSTVAGRWLANGAFLFYGSVSEPYLDAFRTPRLVGDLLGEKLPVVAAARQTLAESRGQPWRLMFLGDPLYRLAPKVRPEPRLDHWDRTADWPAYEEAPRPSTADDNALFLWTLKTSIARLAGGGHRGLDDVAEILLGLDRGRLTESFRPVHDALMVEVLLEARQRGTLRSRLASIPEADRSPALRRTFETLEAIEFHLAIAGHDAAKARRVWSELIRSEVSREFKEQSTERLGKLADSPIRRAEWADLLRKTVRDRASAPEAPALSAELKRIEAAMKADRSAPARS